MGVLFFHAHPKSCFHVELFVLIQYNEKLDEVDLHTYHRISILYILERKNSLNGQYCGGSFIYFHFLGLVTTHLYFQKHNLLMVGL